MSNVHCQAKTCTETSTHTSAPVLLTRRAGGVTWPQRLSPPPIRSGSLPARSPTSSVSATRLGTTTHFNERTDPPRPSTATGTAAAQSTFDAQWKPLRIGRPEPAPTAHGLPEDRPEHEP